MAEIRQGDIAPNFTAQSTEGCINFHNWLGNGWGILFSQPAKYSSPYRSKSGSIAMYKGEFGKRNVKIIALSKDGIIPYPGWINTNTTSKSIAVSFPVIADENKSIFNKYDILHQNTEDIDITSIYIIGPDKKLKLTISYPSSIIIDFNDLLLVIDSLQLTAYHKIAKMMIA